MIRLEICSGTESAYDANMPELTPGINTGILIRPPKPTDWVAGGETGISGILELSGQFDTYLPDEESQALFDPFVFDTMACVTFSGLNNCETLLNRLRALGLLPATHEKFLQDDGYVNKQSGKVNLSDRFTAKMSGTTKNGNYLDAVADSVRTLHGVLPEKDWPFPSMADLNDGELKWQRYYAEVPQELQAKAKKFLDYFQIGRQWVALGTSTPFQFRESLKQGPIQIAASVCSPWSSNDGMPPIPGCGCGTGHATLLYGYRNDFAFKDFDHYKSFRKLLAPDYCIPYGMQYSLTPKALVKPPVFQYTFNKNLQFGSNDPEVRNLQRALQTLTRPNGQPYMKAGVFGPFGPQTRISLGQFQTDNGINDPDGPGMNFGPLTRTKMNQLLSV